MKHILYLTTMPWGWIKQRPQFIPEYLSIDNKVDVYYKKSNSKSKKILINQVGIERDTLKIHSYFLFPFYAIPFIRRLHLDWINKILIRFQLPSFSNYDVIWYTSGMCYELTAGLIGNKDVVYDCMDDILEFPGVKNDKFEYQLALKRENCLLRNSKYVFCSANYLSEKIIQRSGINSDKVIIVNNAIELPTETSNFVLSDKGNNVKDFLCNNDSLLYIGTIERWFDFNLMVRVLNRFPNYHLVLIGPGNNYPKHDRIHHMGVLQHNEIFYIMPYAKALVMPFIVNELIRSVNPVKLYEYIYSGRPVVAPKYGETIKFEPFACLYESEEELFMIIKNLAQIEDNISLTECRSFVSDNTWESRCKRISLILNNK